MPHRERRPALHLLRHRRDGVGGREPLLARRPRASSSPPARSASAGRSWPPRYGADVQTVDTSGARRRAPDDLAARLEELGGAKAVFLTHSETSTGVVVDLQALAAAARPSGALVVVDAVSSLGAVPLEPDEWGIDVVASGSQKALMTPPGLGIATVSPAAWAALGTSPRFYFDWERTRAGQGKLEQRVHARRLARRRR